MKKVLSCLLVGLMASCSGHHAFAMDLSKEQRSPRIEDNRGDYRLAEAIYVDVDGDVWLRLVYVPADWMGDQTLKICVKPIKAPEYTGRPLVCMSIIQQDESVY